MGHTQVYGGGKMATSSITSRTLFNGGAPGAAHSTAMQSRHFRKWSFVSWAISGVPQVTCKIHTYQLGQDTCLTN